MMHDDSSTIMMHDDSGTIASLTRRGADGALYARTPAVEAQIGAAHALPPTALLARASLGTDAEDHLQEEALVYFMRLYRGRGDDDTVNELTEILLRRCTGYIKHWASVGDVDMADDACSTVVEHLIMPILDLESDRADYCQVRFWKALKRLAITTFRQFERERDRGEVTVALGREDDDPAPGALVDLPAPALSPQQRAEYREGLLILLEPHRTAFILRHYHNWPIEDRDPTVPTISSHFNVTPRTIRNWLAEANHTLALWRGEN